MKLLLAIALQKVGNVRTFPRVMVYTSTKYHRLRIKNTWYNRQLKNLHTLIGENSNKKLTGMILQASLELLRIEIGLPDTFKDVPWDKIKIHLYQRT